jgi:hypothetical protein
MRIVFGAKKTLKTWRVAAERGFGFFVQKSGYHGKTIMPIGNPFSLC